MTRIEARHGWLQKLAGWLLMGALLFGLMPVSVAQGETSLRIELKGVFSAQLGSWRSLDLSARFDVLPPDATEPLATLVANQTDEQREVGQTDTLIVPEGITSLRLLPRQEDFENGFVCDGPIEIAVQPGQANVAPIFAYAAQGYFALQTVLSDTQAAVGPAEYIVLDAAGNAVLSFATDETGAYASQTPLPVGSYQLSQVRSPAGALPLAEAVPLELGTYQGRAEDIALARVENQPIPTQNADVTSLRWELPDAVEHFTFYPAGITATLVGVCDAANTLPLRDLTVTLAAPVPTDAAGDKLSTDAACLVSLRVEAPVRVIPCGANGEPLAEAIPLPAGEAVDLSAYAAVQAQITYTNEAGEPQLPAGFDAGAITAKWRIAPYAGDPPASELRLGASVAYTYVYPDADGVGLIMAPSAVADSAVSVPVSAEPADNALAERLSVRLLYEDGRALSGARLTLSQNGEPITAGATDGLGLWGYDALPGEGYRLEVELPPEVSAAFSILNSIMARDDTHVVLEGITLTEESGQAYLLRVAPLCMLEGAARLNGAGVAGAALTLTDGAGRAWQTQTGADGSFALAGLHEGDYTLAVEPVSGMTLVSVNQQAAASAIPVSIDASTENRLALVFEAVAALRGTVPARQAGQNVTVASTSGQVDVPTGVDGAFALDNLPAGEYTIYVGLPSGMAVAAGADWQPTQRGDELWLTVALEAGQQLELPAIVLSAGMEIAGAAYYDPNLNGTREAGESPVAGVRVALQARASDGSWQPLAEAVTDADGAYMFPNLGTGAYRVLATGTAEYAVASVAQSTEAAQDAVASQPIELTEAYVCDIAMAQPSGLTVNAFVDENANGLRGDYEKPFAGGVRVEVLNSAGEAIATGVTSAQGELTLSGLPTGEYSVRFTLPNGYRYTQRGERLAGGNSLVGNADADATGLVAVSEPVPLRAGEGVNVGVALLAVGSLSGRVWNDLSGDGLIGDDEPGVAGIEIRLKGLKTGDQYALVTDETGLYSFTGLRNDTYLITSTLPEGMLFTRYTQTGGDLRSIYTGDLSRTGERQFTVSGAQDVTSKNIGLIYEGSVGGLAFLDTNYNGYFDDGEPAYPGVRVELIKASTGDLLGRATTGDDGVFTLGQLRGSTYRIRVILPEDGSIFSIVPAEANDRSNWLEQRASRRENSIEGYVLQNGQNGRVMIGVAMPASVLGNVFVDQNYDGLQGGKEQKVSGVAVRLLDEQGQTLAETTSVGNGRYKLDGILPGTYTVAFERRSKDEAFTRLPDAPSEAGNTVVRLDGDWGLTAPVEVTMGVDVKNINAGVLPSATITGACFDDINDNGLRDEGEPGAVGVTVALVSEAGETLYTRQIGEDGAYFLDGVLPGRYTLRYQLLPHTELAKNVAGGNTLSGEGLEVDSPILNVAVGEAVEAPLVGVVTLGSLEGVAFHDANANGVRDADETPLAGVALAVSNGAGESVSAQTDVDGSFSLVGLRPGNYRLSAKLPEGYIFSADLPGVPLGMANEAELAIGWESLTSRAAYALGGVRPASVTTSLWLDENMDGARDAEESALEGLSVELVDEATRATLASARTDARGLASFAAVRPGTYTLRFDLPEQAQPANSENTFVQRAGAMAQSGLMLTEGQTYADATCGLISRTSIAGNARLDQAGTLVAQSGLMVRLYQDGGASPVQTTETDERGAYRFDGLWPAEYVVEFAQPAGTLFVSKQDSRFAPEASAVTGSDGQNGRTDGIQLRMAQNRLDVDAVLLQPAVIGELAWLDLNQNGLIDIGEPGIPGVTVELLQGDRVVAATTTDAYGYYVFDDVYPGEYRLRASAYAELTPTKRVQSLEIISSCLTSGDGASAESEPFTVESGVRYSAYHLGYALVGDTWPDAITQGPTKDWTHGYDYVNKW